MNGSVKIGIAFVCGLFAATPFGLVAYAQSTTTVQALDSRLSAIEQALAKSQAANAPVTTAQFTVLTDRVSNLEKGGSANQKALSDLKNDVDKFHDEYAHHGHVYGTGYIQIQGTKVLLAAPNGSGLTTSRPIAAAP